MTALTPHRIAYVGLDKGEAFRIAKYARSNGHHVDYKRRPVTGSTDLFHYTVIVYGGTQPVLDLIYGGTK